MFNKILVVCMGNICRSPVVEKLLQNELPDSFTVRSAGIKAVKGHGIHRSHIPLIEAKGISNLEHSATQIDAEQIMWADLILVMEHSHIDSVCHISPASRGKVHLLSKWDGNDDIPDPFKCSEEFINMVFEQMQKSTQSWLQKLV